MTQRYQPPKNVSISVTDAAKKYFKNLILEDPSAKGILLGTQKEGCSGFTYKIDLYQEIGESDQLIIQEKDLSIAMTKKSFSILNGVTIDYQKSQLGLKKIIITNPNATGECGCGESFTVDLDHKEHDDE